MSSSLTPSHPLFALPHDTSRSYLTWARRLAQAEAILLLFAACSRLDTTPSGPHLNAYAITAAIIALVYLIVAYHVGQGNARAAVTLLGLSIVRSVVAYLPGAPVSGGPVAPLLILDLFVFTQATRAAIALARPDKPRTTPVPRAKGQSEAGDQLQLPLALSIDGRPIAKPSRAEVAAQIATGKFAWPKPWVDEQPRVTTLSEDIARIHVDRFTLDFIAASILLAIGMGGLAEGFQPTCCEGAAALGGLYGLFVAAINLPMAAVMFAAARAAGTNKFWRAPRIAVYAVLVSELLGSFDLLTSFIRAR